MYATLRGCVEVVEELVKAGANVDLKSQVLLPRGCLHPHRHWIDVSNVQGECTAYIAFLVGRSGSANDIVTRRDTLSGLIASRRLSTQCTRGVDQCVEVVCAWRRRVVLDWFCCCALVSQDGLHAGQIAERESRVEIVRYFRSRGLVRVIIDADTVNSTTHSPSLFSSPSSLRSLPPPSPLGSYPFPLPFLLLSSPPLFLSLSHWCIVLVCFELLCLI